MRRSDHLFESDSTGSRFPGGSGTRLVRRGQGLVCVVALVALVATIGAGSAGAGTSFGPKVDASLAAAATGAPATAQLHAIVYGSDLATANADLGTALTVRQPLGTIGGESVTVTVANLPKLAAEAGVDYLTLDRDIVPTGSTRPALSGNLLSTQYPAIDGAVTAWKKGLDGSNVGVAVIDSGVTPGPDFANPNRVEQVKLNGQKDGNGALNDPYGHGTFVAGVVGGFSTDGRFIGIAPNSKIEAINISRPDGVRTSDVMASLLWVLAHYKDKHIGVVNLSLTETAASSYLSSPLDAVVERLWRAGVVIVVSAGNKGPGTTSFAPANDPFVITVGATDTTVSPAVPAAFSSSGLTQDGIAKPELMAPGRRIGSLLPAGTVLDGQAPTSARLGTGYVQMSGTSFSAPQVTGAVALLLQSNPSLTPDQVKAILTSTAAPVVGSPVGTLDVAAALAATTPTTVQTFPPARWSATPPPPTAHAASPAPLSPEPAVIAATQPVPPNLGTKITPSYATPTSKSCKSCVSALAADAAAAALPATSTPNVVTAAWEKAAKAWENVPAWSPAADDWAKAAAAWDGASTYDKGVGDWQSASADYEKAAAWDKAAAWEKAAAAWESVGTDLDRRSTFDKAAAAWDAAIADRAGAGNAAPAAADAAMGAADWERNAAAVEAANTAPLHTPSSGEWDRAAAAWNAAANDQSLAGGSPAQDWYQSALDGDAAARIYGNGTNQALADQKLAALRFDSAAAEWSRAAAWEKSAAAWNGAQNDWNQVAGASDTVANALQSTANTNKKPADYAKAAAAWDASTGNWQNYAGAYQHSAAAWEKAAAWDKAAAAWDKAAAAWDRNAAAWDHGAAAWSGAGNTAAAGADASSRDAARVSKPAAEELSGAAWNNFAATDPAHGYANAANEYSSASGDWQRAAAWERSAAAWEKTAAAWEKAAAWEQAADAWDRAAAAWDTNGTWDHAAAAWDNGANDWSNALQLDRSTADLNGAGLEWSRAGQWDKASFDWMLAATRDPTAGWNSPSGLDNGATWQADAHAWYDAAAWN